MIKSDLHYTKYWQKRKGTQGLIEIENPNVVKSKNVKAKNADVSLANLFFLYCFSNSIIVCVKYFILHVADWENKWTLKAWKVCKYFVAFVALDIYNPYYIICE